MVEGVNLRELARSHTKKAVETLYGIMTNEEAPEAARISAANSILDRGYGRPVQMLGDEDGNSINWVDFLLAARTRAFSEQRDSIQ